MHRLLIILKILGLRGTPNSTGFGVLWAGLKTVIGIDNSWTDWLRKWFRFRCLINHLVNHQVEVFSMIASIWIVNQPHFEVESVHLDWIINKLPYLLEHLLQQVLIQLQLLDYFIRLPFFLGVCHKLCKNCASDYQFFRADELDKVFEVNRNALLDRLVLVQDQIKCEAPRDNL